MPVEAPPCPLVGEGGIGETVADDHLAARQRGLDHLDQVVTAGGKHHQGLGQRVHGIVQQQLAQLFRQRRATGLARQGHRAPGLAEGLGQRVDVRRLAGAVDAFKSDEKSGRCSEGHNKVSIQIKRVRRPSTGPTAQRHATV